MGAFSFDSYLVGYDAYDREYSRLNRQEVSMEDKFEGTVVWLSKGEKGLFYKEKGSKIIFPSSLSKATEGFFLIDRITDKGKYCFASGKNVIPACITEDFFGNLLYVHKVERVHNFYPDNSGRSYPIVTRFSSDTPYFIHEDDDGFYNLSLLKTGGQSKGSVNLDYSNYIKKLPNVRLVDGRQRPYEPAWAGESVKRENLMWLNSMVSDAYFGYDSRRIIDDISRDEKFDLVRLELHYIASTMYGTEMKQLVHRVVKDNIERIVKAQDHLKNLAKSWPRDNYSLLGKINNHLKQLEADHRSLLV